MKSCKNAQPSDTDLKAMVNNNWCFMETLLKEVKTKVSNMMNACFADVYVSVCVRKMFVFLIWVL